VSKAENAFAYLAAILTLSRFSHFTASMVLAAGLHYPILYALYSLISNETKPERH
jgi:hypothetical protein